MSWPHHHDDAPLESYSRAGSALRRFEHGGMGTTNVLLLEDEPDGVDPPDLEQAAGEAFATVEVLEARLSKFRPDSEVARLNRLPPDTTLAIGADLTTLIELSQQAADLTDGAFDPTVGPLLDAWGLTDGTGRQPSDAELAAARARVGMRRLQIDAATGLAGWRGAAGVLDLGGIGKGYAADRVAELLREHSIASGALVFGRSTLVVWGRPPGEEGWDVDVIDPESPEDALCRLRVEPGVLSTSGDYERGVRSGTRTIAHVLDPRTAAPVAGARCATVWTRTAVLGDVLSTALLILGADALRSGGPFERLVRAWTPPGEEPRASATVWVRDPSAWGGLRRVERHLGELPGYRELPASS